MYVLIKPAENPLGFEIYNGFKTIPVEEENATSRPVAQFQAITTHSFERNERWIDATIFTTMMFAATEAVRISKIILEHSKEEVELRPLHLGQLEKLLQLQK